MTEKVKLNTIDEEGEDVNCSSVVTDQDSRALYVVNQSWESSRFILTTVFNDLGIGFNLFYVIEEPTGLSELFLVTFKKKLK